MKTPHLIEALESRIAPAAVFTFTDVDGDKVTVNISKGANTDAAFSVFAGQLQTIDLGGKTLFDGADISITAVPTAGQGDGHVNVGFLNATGVDLGKVSIPGDLGRIAAGDKTAPAPALAKLRVDSLGALGLSTQAAGGTLDSPIDGRVGALLVGGDIVDATFHTLAAGEHIGVVKVGGSIIHGGIRSLGDLGSITVGGSVLGGSVLNSGEIFAQGKLGSVKIGGSLIGGSASNAGRIISIENPGTVFIGGDVQGGSGVHTGNIVIPIGAITAGSWTASNLAVGIAAGVDGKSAPAMTR